jgi:hypothetical protein
MLRNGISPYILGNDNPFNFNFASRRIIFQPVEKCHFSVELPERRAFLGTAMTLRMNASRGINRGLVCVRTGDGW